MASREPVVMVVGDPARRSLLAAHLTMDGEMVLVADSCRDIAMPLDSRTRTILIIDEALLPDTHANRGAAALGFADTIVLVARAGAPSQRDRIASIEAAHAARDVPALVRSCRLRAR